MLIIEKSKMQLSCKKLFIISAIIFQIKQSYSFPVEKHDLFEVLKLSLLFYEAQRSGHLPDNSRIPWRGSSALDDKGKNGEDLTGGYYDASDFVKFGFTIAFTTTILNWGLISYKDAYIKSGQYNHTIEAIKWSTDYFIKCHASPNEFYGQVGDFKLDHQFWGRPEELNMPRPAYKIDSDHPGSDLAGEVAAALASTSIIFKHINESYSNLTLKHARELYNFAVNYKGLYNDAIPGAKQYYQSTNYGDELTWAAIWLYLATKDESFLDDAKTFYLTFNLNKNPKEFFYNNKIAGVQVLLAELTNKTKYLEQIQTFCDFSLNKQKRTPRGLLYIDKSGTLSHAANVAFVCLKAAKLGNTAAEKYEEFAVQQLNYILGHFGQSFVVGYGKKYPKFPYHTASSCPDKPAPCDWSSYTNTEPNPQILYGALVSGPDENDYYLDTREEYLYNEVSLDYNAGFQSLCAGVLDRELKKSSLKN